ncbi:MAG: phosphodiester glycosidase family protein [Erythrobacter sp.]|uniref:phosphodiester glycosidase family protein n=1 Tax=Erythrobacter sp. TaxID=1042 RepID=UPI0026315D15|nr:phosphodiester glycosidase family protein [Erythrobacter sp.]MDJ0977787.1 phosphodiester glycosidase family protein [Erythrobacter sp.]
MRVMTLLFLAPLALLISCKEAPAGQPVVTVDLSDEEGEILPVPANEAELAAASSPFASVCAPATFETISLTHCIADPESHTISAVYRPSAQAAPYGSLSAYAASVDPTTIAFATNGGAFTDDLSPRGYLVTAGERLSTLDRGSGEANFYLKPNGVFFGSGARWRILTTTAFFSTVRDRPQFGTQSGPMLLVDGELGAAIGENGNSRAIRNAVGVDEEGKAHFVISNAPISYGQLARYFRDELSVPNALFLDANSSSLWNPATGRMDEGRTGPILVVTRKATP